MLCSLLSSYSVYFSSSHFSLSWPQVRLNRGFRLQTADCSLCPGHASVTYSEAGCALKSLNTLENRKSVFKALKSLEFWNSPYSVCCCSFDFSFSWPQVQPNKRFRLKTADCSLCPGHDSVTYSEAGCAQVFQILEYS